MTDLTVAEWDHKSGRYIMTTGRRISLPAGTKIKAGKVLPQQQRLAAGQARNKAMKAGRLEKAWRAKSK